MTRSDIEDLKKAWLASVKRAVECGFDVIEIHNAQYVNFPCLVFTFLMDATAATSYILSARQRATTALMSMEAASKTAHVSR